MENIHRFIVWVAYQDRLLTKARLQRLNMLTGDEKYSLCVDDQVVAQKHLFVNCAWAREVQQALYCCLGVPLKT